MNARRNHSRRRGFTLVELLQVVLLMAAFSVLATELFIMTMKASTQSVRRDELLGRVDSALAQLRRDVWSAEAITLQDGTLSLHRGKDELRWSSTAEGLTRLELPREQRRRWNKLPALTFELRGPQVIVHVGDGADDTVVLVSQVQLAGGTP